MQDINVMQLIIWIIVGALAGSLAGMVITRRRRGLGRLQNVLVGMVGAVIGGVLFGLLNIDLGLDQFSISLEDLLSAFVGSLILLLLLRFLSR